MVREVKILNLINCFFIVSYINLGYGVNQIDIAPTYAGILMGVTNTIEIIFQYFFYYIIRIMYDYEVITITIFLLFTVLFEITIQLFCCIDNKI